MFCKYCGKKIEKPEQPCPHCGKEQGLLCVTDGYFGILRSGTQAENIEIGMVAEMAVKYKGGRGQQQHEESQPGICPMEHIEPQDRELPENL